MTKPGHRSRTFRRVHVKTPGAKNRVQYRKRKPAPAKCGACGAVLKGVPRERPYKLAKLPKTKKRPERPFGGVICSRCTREKIVGEARCLK